MLKKIKKEECKQYFQEIAYLNIKRLVYFGIIILIIQICSLLLKKTTLLYNHFLPSDTLSYIMMFVIIIYVFLATNIIKNKKFNIKYVRFIYISFSILLMSLSIPSIYFQFINELEIYTPLLILVVVCFFPFFNLKQGLLILFLSIIVPIYLTISFDLPISYIYRLIIFYISIISISQIIFINYSNNLKKTLRLEKINRKLIEKSETDHLTGLLNRHGLHRELEEFLEFEKNCQKKFAIAMIDIDFFKSYNDTFGHQQGDICLKIVANCINSNIIREHDFVARYGGEEFIALFIDVTEEQSIKIAKRINEKIEELKIDAANKTISEFLTVSIGLKFVSDTKNINYKEIVKQADRQLYFVKENGRNGVSINNVLHKNNL